MVDSGRGPAVPAGFWKLSMRRLSHSVLVLLLALISAMVLAVSSTTVPAVRLTANAVITMRGTGAGTPSVPFTTGIMDNFIRPTHPELADFPVSDVRRLYTPEDAWPLTGLLTAKFNQSVRIGVDILTSTVDTTTSPSDHVVISGISQSAVISTEYKRTLAKLYPGTAPLPGAPDISFVLAGNLNRPNGGLMMRFKGLYIPIVAFSFNGATPTDTRFPTADIAQQYDGFADFPNYPINAIAVLNALMGIVYLHPKYAEPANTLAGHPEYQQGPAVGDTTYYLIPTKNLPILDPIRNVAALQPLVALIEPALKVIVDAGYNRNISPGTPTRAQLIPRINPATFIKDLINAVEQGITDVHNLPSSVAATSSTAITTAAPTARASAAAGRKAKADSTIRSAGAASAVRPHSRPAQPNPSRAQASASLGA
jgi:hypothetical protein